MGLPATNTIKFWKDGYLIIKNAFTEAEIKNLRAEVESYAKNIPSGASKGDILSNENTEINKIIYDSRILHAAKEILGSTPVYFGDSTISIGSHHRGWHKDNRIPDRWQHHLADWDSKYSLIRFGVYLQDHKYHSGGLAVRQKSHNPSKLVRKLNKLKLPFVSDLTNLRISTRTSILASCLYGKARILDLEVGDLVVWNQRTTHSGNALRNKILPKFKMPTWVENKLPDNLQRKYQHDRIALFMTYGLEDQHLKHTIEYLKKRRYMVNSWKVSHINDSTLTKINAKDLLVQQPPEIKDDWVPPMS